MKCIILLLSFGLLLGCSFETTTVEQDVTEYCECMNDNTSQSDMEKCVKLIQKINDKYQFDSEAVEFIKKEVANCGAN